MSSVSAINTTRDLIGGAIVIEELHVVLPKSISKTISELDFGIVIKFSEINRRKFHSNLSGKVNLVEGRIELNLRKSYQFKSNVNLSHIKKYNPKTDQVWFINELLPIFSLIFSNITRDTQFGPLILPARFST